MTLACHPAGAWTSGLLSNSLAGTRGFPHALGATLAEGTISTALLEWTEELGCDGENVARRVHQNGEQIESVIGSRHSLIPCVRGSNRFDLLALSRHEETWMGPAATFSGMAIGSRVRLAWDSVPEDEDFFATEIWWDAGDGEDPDTLLALVRGRDQCQYVTAQLAEGAYKFARGHRDRLGNSTGPGEGAVTIAVNRAPLALAAVEWTYSDETRKATFTWEQPAGQGSDVVGVAVYDNFLTGLSPADGFTDSPNLERGLRRAFVALGTAEWTTPTLFPQTLVEGAVTLWRFALRAVDAMGNESEFTEQVIALQLNSGVLEEVTEPPARPTGLRAYLIAGAKVRLRWRHTGGAEAFRVSITGQTALSVAGDQRQVLTGALPEIETTFTIAALNDDGIASPESDPVTVTPDGTAPSGDTDLTATLEG